MLRGDQALFGGLYGLPMAPLEAPDDSSSHHAAAEQALAAAGVMARLGSNPVGEVQHVLSHRRLRVVVFTATHARIASEGTSGDPSARLLTLDARGELGGGDVGVAKLTRKILALAGGEAQAPRATQSRRAHTK